MDHETNQAINELAVCASDVNAYGDEVAIYLAIAWLFGLALGAVVWRMGENND